MFRRYSAHNTMLLALDFHLRGIEPEPVAGFRVWLKLGRCVRMGEHGIRIAARVTPKKDEPGTEHTEPQLDKRAVRFTTVAVFERLSRVRFGGCRRRPSREIPCPAGLPPVLLVSASASATAKGTAVACAVVAEPAPEGDGAAAIARAPRRHPRQQKRADQLPRMPPLCPHTGNLADRRQVRRSLPPRRERDLLRVRRDRFDEGAAANETGRFGWR
jgi:hypothetical protein